MGLRISGKNLAVGDALRGKAEDHFEAVVSKYFDGNYDGHLTLAHEGIGYRADCVVHLDSGAVLQASASGNDPTGAYETMADHIEKRLRRYNRKLKDRRRLNGDAEPTVVTTYVLEAAGEEEELSEDYSPPIIAESTSDLRRMSVGEAVMELDLAQHDVLVFRHAGHGGVNVVYRRPDGNIGWIDPAQAAN